MTEPTSKHVRDLAMQMLSMVGSDRYRSSGARETLVVAIAGITVSFDHICASFDRPLEQLATAIEESIAVDRAQSMLAAADAVAGPVPLWLVTGSSVLAAWLAWSRTEAAFRRRLTLSDQVGFGPIVGMFDRRARHDIGQTAVKVRVRSGLAVGERIGLPGRVRSVATFGQQATIRVQGHPLPDTLIAALADGGSEDGNRRVADVVDHPFFTYADLMFRSVRNDGADVLIGLESQWRPLGPVPEPALKAVPTDADPACPWRATAREIKELYALVDAGRNHESNA